MELLLAPTLMEPAAILLTEAGQGETEAREETHRDSQDERSCGSARGTEDGTFGRATGELSVRG